MQNVKGVDLVTMTKKRLKQKIHLQKTKFGEYKAKSCTHKKPYNSYLEAMAWGRFANEKYNQNNIYSAYFCRFCHHWHLTTKGSKNEQENSK